MYDMFDWNGDGKLDHWEEANKILFLYYLTHQDDTKDATESSFHPATNRSDRSGCGTIACIIFIVLIVIGFFC